MIKENKDVVAPKQETPKQETVGTVLSNDMLVPVKYKNHTYYYDPVLGIITNKDSTVML